MEELKEQIAAYLVSNEYTSFVGKFEGDEPKYIFEKGLAADFTAVSWIEFRHNGETYQMYLAKVI